MRRLALLAFLMLSGTAGAQSSSPIYKCAAKYLGGFDSETGKFRSYYPDQEFRIEPYSTVFPRLSEQERGLVVDEINLKIAQYPVTSALVDGNLKLLERQGKGTRTPEAKIAEMFPQVGYLVRLTDMSPTDAASYMPCTYATSSYHCGGRAEFQSFHFNSENSRFTYTYIGGWSFGRDDPSMVVHGTCKAHYY